MHALLGLDAAWTPNAPSGVALLEARANPLGDDDAAIWVPA